MFAIQRIIQSALEEDIGLGDITTEVTVAPGTMARAEVVAKEDFILSGIKVAAQVFQTVDVAVDFEALQQDGHRVRKGEVIAWLRGPASSLLKGERVALNLLQRMCAIATLTSRYVAAVAGTRAVIVDTRKTVPGLRVLDKYSVRMGGGRNHRIGLFDGVLIKENHIAAAGGIAEAISRAKVQLPHTLKIEIETQNTADVEQALAAGADIIMLDNMGFDEMRQAVSLIDGRALVEASGGVKLETVADIAATGVDIISVGALTHSINAADISMLFD